MAIIHQKDKRSGITYAYESKAYWDKEKKQSRAKRTLIGRVNDKGEIVPTDGRCKRGPNNQLKTKIKNSNDITKIKRTFYGATYALEKIAIKLGLLEDLQSCVKSELNKLLSIVFYLILGNNRALMNFNYWAANHTHPYAENISSQDSSRLFASISDEQVNNFFKLQAKRRIEKEYWAYDSTSISSYSETLEQIKYGKNK
jgi:hypothetical protein